MMPEVQLDTMTREQIRDVIAYLAGTAKVGG
jgi:hypothetical protein